jgi:hypothetical protein
MVHHLARWREVVSQISRTHEWRQGTRLSSHSGNFFIN